MKSKQGSHQKTSSQCACCLLQQPKQEQDISCMQQHVNHMVSAWIEPEELAVRHVRKPRHRVPVSCLQTAKGPTEVRKVQSGANMTVSGDVVGIVKVQEIVVDDWKIQQQCGRCKQSRGDPPIAAWAGKQSMPTAGLDCIRMAQLAMRFGTS